MIGTLSNLMSIKKYGFISGENGQEYFFHMADMGWGWDSLVERFRVEGGGKIKMTFTPLKTPKGPRAKDVMTAESVDD